MEENVKKKTGRFGRFLGWLLSIVLLLLLADGMEAAYPKITEGARKIYSQDPGELQEESARRYTQEAADLIYGMYVDWYYHMYSTDAEPGSLLLGIKDTKQSAYVNKMPDYFEYKKRWYENEYRTNMEKFDLLYHIEKDTEEGMIDYGTLVAEAAMADAVSYPYLLRITFDENGVPTVLTERGGRNAQEAFDKVYSDMVWEQSFYLETSDIAESEIALAETTLTIASKSENYLNVYDTYQYKSDTFWRSLHEMMQVNYPMFVFGALGIVVLLGLILPAIRPLGLKEGWKANIPFEIAVTALAFVVAAVVEPMPEFLLRTQMQIDFPGSVFYWYGIWEEWMVGETEVLFLETVHILIWSLLFLVTYFCTVSLRQIFTKGLIRYCKENTLCGKIVCFVVRILRRIGRSIKKLVEYVCDIDFKENGTRKLGIFVGINLLVIIFCSCIWFFGILVAIVYSALLFVLLRKKWSEIHAQYEALLQTTEEMASGELDVEYLGEAGAFSELQSSLKKVQTGFGEAVKKEVKSERMKTELITNVSHDLKTPLTAIITYVDLLKKEDITEEERQSYLGVVEQKSARLKTLIEDLFEVSKASSGNIQLETVELDLRQLLQEVQVELEDEIMKSGIEFKMSLPEEKVMLSLDAAKTSRIFENLMVNITKYGLKGSRAYIQLEDAGTEVRVSMRNVSATEISFDSTEIMERFTRGDESRNTEGSGLGLAIVKSFVEAQGGRVEIRLEDDLFKVTVIFVK